MTGASGRLFDPGLQPERTALAWRRTALAFTLGPAVLARMLAPHLGWLSVVALTLGLVVGGWMYLTSMSRYRRVSAVLTGGAERAPGAGVLFACTCLTVAGAGAVALALVLG